MAQDEGLHLKKKGRNYFTCCPFHSERTESFSINPQKQIFKCFGCGEGGDVISLLAKLRGVSKGKILWQYGKEFGLIGEPSPEQKKEIQLREVEYEFIQYENNNFTEVYYFLCDKIHGYRRSMKQAKNWREVKAMQHFYRIYDLLPYYEYLLDCMDGDYGEMAQVESYLEAEGVMDEWNQSYQEKH